MNALRAAWALFLKDVRIEARTRELTLLTGFFMLMVAVLFSFAFQTAIEQMRAIFAGLFWLAFLFASSLTLQFGFLREQWSDTLSLLRLAPVDPSAILLGKVASNVAFLLGAEAVFLPVFGVLFNVPIFDRWRPLVGVLVLGSLGLAVVGSVFSALVATARLRELLLPLLLLPVLSPLLIACVELTADALEGPAEGERLWWSVLVAFDGIYVVASWLLAEFLIPE